MNYKSTPEIDFWPFVILMAMIFSLSPFAIDMYLPALPSMAIYFSSSIDTIEASVAIYLLFFAFGQLVLGALADSMNKAKLLLIGLSVFSVASCMIALTTSLESLYFWRAIQAFSSGSSVVVFALIHHFYGGRNMNQIISYVMACVLITPLVAPMIGSQILIAFNWQGIFIALAILALIILLTQVYLMPAKIVVTKLQPLNLKALYQGYRKVLTNGTVMIYILAGSSSFAGLFAFIAGSPFVYMEYFGATAEQFSYLVALNAVGMITLNLLNARLLTHIDATKKLIVAGLLLGVVGGYLVIVASFQLSFVYVVIGVVSYIALLGLTAANAISAALASIQGNTGVLSGVNGVMQFGLGAVASGVVSISQSVDASAMNFTMAASAFSTLFFVILLYSKSAVTAAKINKITS